MASRGFRQTCRQSILLLFCLSSTQFVCLFLSVFLSITIALHISLSIYLPPWLSVHIPIRTSIFLTMFFSLLDVGSDLILRYKTSGSDPSTTLKPTQLILSRPFTMHPTSLYLSLSFNLLPFTKITFTFTIKNLRHTQQYSRPPPTPATTFPSPPSPYLPLPFTLSTQECS